MAHSTKKYNNNECAFQSLNFVHLENIYNRIVYLSIDIDMGPNILYWRIILCKIYASCSLNNSSK